MTKAYAGFTGQIWELALGCGQVLCTSKLLSYYLSQADWQYCEQVQNTVTLCMWHGKHNSNLHRTCHLPELMQSRGKSDYRPECVA